MTLTQGRRTELLGGCPLFGGSAEEDLDALAGVASEVEFPAGRVIARQGEIGTGFFVVVHGRVRVVRDGRTLAELGPADFFGELSVIDQQPRVAQVVAIEPTTCLAVASWDFEQVLLDHPRLSLGILRGLAARLRELTEHPRH
jgi:CRP/FNR family transcriptional regulator, cyclic AMP receptor protein